MEKVTLLVLSFATVCLARPEYSYPQPSGSYGAPQIGGSIGHIGGGIGGSIGHIGGSGFGGGIGGGSLGHIGGSGFGGGIGGGIGGGSLGHIGGGSGFGGGGGYDNGYAGNYQSVQKHIYVHVPPPEPIEHKQQHIPIVHPPQKHYKIIFIKAPTPATPTAPIIPLQPQNEEKTLVYVLVKKPEEQPDVIIPTPQPTQPSKPEVYFIKYRTQKDGGAGGLGGLGGLGGAGGLGGLGGAGGLDGHGSGIGGSGIGGSGIGGSGIGGSAGDAGQYGPPGHVPGSLLNH